MAGFFRTLFGGGKDEAADGRPADGMPRSIEEGMRWQAADFVAAFTDPASPIDGSKLDYSEASLALVDRVLDDFHRQGASLPDDLPFLASAYVFEVARRQFGGRYMRGDGDDPFVLVVGIDDAEIGVCVMSKIRGRAVNGPDDNIPFFYAGIGPAVAAGKPATLI